MGDFDVDAYLEAALENSNANGEGEEKEEKKDDRDRCVSIRHPSPQSKIDRRIPTELSRASSEMRCNAQL